MSKYQLGDIIKDYQWYFYVCSYCPFDGYRLMQMLPDGCTQLYREDWVERTFEIHSSILREHEVL